MQDKDKKKPGFLGKALRILLPLAIIGGGITAGKYLNATPPKARRSKPVKAAPLVETLSVSRSTSQVEISAMGTVVPARKLTLKAKVGGEVIKTSPEFLPGGFFTEGETVLQMDPADYNLNVSAQKALVNKAKAALDLEMGGQEVAREELLMMQRTSGRTIGDTTLALRKPQLAQAQADLDSAESALKKARLDLSRTRITAPMNSMILETLVEKGSQVNAREPMATMVGTDYFRVEALVPTDMLKWLIFPEKNETFGSMVYVETAAGIQKTGHIIRLLGDLTPGSLMARVLIQVEDPLGLKPGSPSGRLLLGSYVTLRIQGIPATGIIEIPRSAVRDGNLVWVKKQGKLDVRTVTQVWKSQDTVLIGSGLEDGDKVITTNISAPVPGMKLRSADDAPNEGTPERNLRPEKQRNKERKAS